MFSNKFGENIFVKHSDSAKIPHYESKHPGNLWKRYSAPFAAARFSRNSIVEIDVREAAENEEKELTNAEKIKAFDEWYE